MSYIAIPLAVLESPAYIALSLADQKFLVDLYVVYHDCERFTVDMDKTELYRQPSGAQLRPKVSRLSRAGFLKIVGYIGPKSHQRRVFEFTHKALELLEAA